jgi:hypothetical protein
MKFKPRQSNRIDPQKLGIDTSTPEYEKIKSATDTDGQVALEQVYDIPMAADEQGKHKTLVNIMEHNGIEYSEKEYQKEYQLRAAHQIMINGGSTLQIAQALSIPLNAARNLKKELAARQMNEIQNFNAKAEIAKAYMFYDHIAAKALQIANKPIKAGDKNGGSLRTAVESLKVALQAQSDKQKFLALAGAYETGLRSGTGTNRHADDASDIRDMLSGVLTGDGAYEAVVDQDEFDDNIEILA